MHTAAKRQFRIWKHELLEFWDHIPFYGRVVLGAGIAIGLSLLCVKQVLQPLNGELSELRENLLVPENLDPETDEQIIMDRDRAAKLQVSLKQWKERLAQFQSQAEYLQPEVHLSVISEIQSIIERCGLMLVSENLVVPEQAEAPKSRRGRVKEAPKPKDDGPMGTYTHRYEVRGGFRQIQAFLLLVEPLEWRLSLHDFELEPVGEGYNTLSLKFVLDIHYLKEKL
jgi:hypothetical protein